MSTVAEHHSTDLTEACLRRVQLRHEGKMFGQTTGALYVGSVVHDALADLYRRDQWTREAAESATMAAARSVEARSRDENRPLSEAVREGRSAFDAEALQLVNLYAQRCHPDPRDKVIGVELPIRFTLEHPSLDEPAEFASHLDLLFRRDGVLYVRDFKTGEDSPHGAYLARNLQMGLYWIAVRHGAVMVGDDWIDFGEWPVVEWCHMRSLKPYAKATKAADDNGEEVEFKRGDLRPIRMVVREIAHATDAEGVLRDELALRVRMARAGMWPTNPDPVGCGLCECRGGCPAFDRGGAS